MTKPAILPMRQLSPLHDQHDVDDEAAPTRVCRIDDMACGPPWAGDTQLGNLCKVCRPTHAIPSNAQRGKLTMKNIRYQLVSSVTQLMAGGMCCFGNCLSPKIACDIQPGKPSCIMHTALLTGSQISVDQQPPKQPLARSQHHCTQHCGGPLPSSSSADLDHEFVLSMLLMANPLDGKQAGWQIDGEVILFTA